MNTPFDRAINAYRENFDIDISKIKARISELAIVERAGKIVSAVGSVIIAVLPNVKIGDLCEITNTETNFHRYAEVLAIDGNMVKLLPFGNIQNIAKNFIIRKIGSNFSIRVGNFMLGTIMDGFCNILGTLSEKNNRIRLHEEEIGLNMCIDAPAPNSLQRPIIEDIFTTGVTAIDLLMTIGIGQRIGIFAKAGLGKTTLMGMILRNSNADIIVVGLIGERGREVKEFIDIELDSETHTRCVLVVSTSDKPPIEQMKCAFVAQTIAEYFRDQGKKVLLFIDSITRFARATREVGLSAGEPPVRSGYPPSTFLSFPRLMERAGQSHLGSITAFYTILLESDNFNEDPIADEVKSILDGHIILSSKYAKNGHFPAIDPLSSLSRIADRIIDPIHLQAATKLRKLLAKYEEVEFLIRVGEYNQGADKEADEAIAKYPAIMQMLKQSSLESRNFLNDLNWLKSIVK